MDNLPSDNAIYEEVKAVSSGERFSIHKNKCYCKITSAVKKITDGGKSVPLKSPLSLVFLVVLALLLGTAFACMAFSVQIATLKSDIASLQRAIPSLRTDILEEVHQLNSSNDMLYQKLSQQLNVSINMLYQQLSPSIDSLYQQLRQLDNRTQQLNTSLLNGPPAGQFPFNPAASCAALPPSSPSGYYWVRASDGSAVSVYCDMTRSCGGITGGWMRVAELDMTNSSHQCPSGLMERIYSGKRTCVRIEAAGGCSHANNFITPDIQYSNVCGRVIGYQYGTTDSFIYSSSSSVNSRYVDGVSLTHGDPSREHIWTFAAAQDEVGTSPSSNCPCINADQSAQARLPPAFVGNDYFCDTGSEERRQFIFYGEDPLWDGAGCGPLNTCCSFNNPPWFYKQLPQPTTDDIEMKLCTDSNPDTNENVAIEIVEMYVQ